MLKNRIQCIKIQVFLSYVLVLSLSFAVLGFGVAMAARQIMTNQIGSSRIDLLRQISERTNTVKTSATTLVGLYRYGIADLTEIPENMDELLQADKRRYSGVFGPIGMDNDPLLVTGQGIYSSFPEQELPPYLESQLWYRRLRRKVLDAPAGTVVFGSTFPTADGTRYQFAVAQALEQFDGECILMVLMDERVLQDLYEPVLTDGSEIYIYDQQGYIVSHPNKKLLGKQFVDPQAMATLYGANSASVIRKQGKAYLLTNYLDENTGWTIVEEIPADMIFGELDRMYELVFTILGVCLVLGLGAALYQSQKIARPLTGLSKAMDSFGGGDFTPVPTDTGTREIDTLSQSFNHMAGEISSLMNRVTEQERQKRLAEMNFLRAQINPHFLYNTLNTINYYIRSNPDNARKLVQNLSDYFRHSLNNPSRLIPLAEELHVIECYTELERARFGDKLKITYKFPEGKIDRIQIPPLLLQPLVENAIIHGIFKKEGGGKIQVGLIEHPNHFKIYVWDTGIGIPARKRRRLLISHKRRDQIGLINVHQRLISLFGSSAGLHIVSKEGWGTLVFANIPKIEKEEEKKDSADTIDQTIVLHPKVKE